MDLVLESGMTENVSEPRMAPPLDLVAAYKRWVESEAQKIGSDGCTLVSEWHQWCCFEHDLGCHYLKDAKKAFEIYLKTSSQGLGVDPWALAPEMSRRQVDKRFAECNLASAKGLKDKLRAGVRYIGVRIGAWIPKWPF